MVELNGSREVVFKADLNGDGIEDRVIREQANVIRRNVQESRTSPIILGVNPGVGVCDEDYRDRSTFQAGDSCTVTHYHVEYGTLDGGYSWINSQILGERIYSPEADLLGTAVAQFRQDRFLPRLDQGIVVGGTIQPGGFLVMAERRPGETTFINTNFYNTSHVVESWGGEFLFGGAGLYIADQPVDEE